jgi:8-amino-7-oxononanoate synthase
MADAWNSWIDGSLQQLNENHLTRVLRPLVATQSAVRVRAGAEIVETAPRALAHRCFALPAAPFAQQSHTISSLQLTHSTQAAIHPDQLDAWLQGAPALSDPRTLPTAADAATTSSSTSPPLRPVRLFGLNDYMGLSTHPDVCRAAAGAALAAGMGPRSSALVCGFTTEHRALELELARLKGTEDALLFPTGGLLAEVDWVVGWVVVGYRTLSGVL